MGILDRLFPGTPKPPGPEQEISRIIDRFTTATIMGIDREDLGRYPAKQYKVMAFHYGAIEYLAGQYGLEELQTLGLFVAFLDKYFNLPVTETGSIAEPLHSNAFLRRAWTFSGAGTSTTNDAPPWNWASC
jgi:hypothetical protein